MKHAISAIIALTATVVTIAIAIHIDYDSISRCIIVRLYPARCASVDACS